MWNYIQVQGRSYRLKQFLLGSLWMDRIERIGMRSVVYFVSELDETLVVAVDVGRSVRSVRNLS